LEKIPTNLRSKFSVPFFHSPSIFPQEDNGKDFEFVGDREPGQPYLAVTILSARNLPMKEDDISSFSFLTALQYMYCNAWIAPVRSVTLQTTKQPRIVNPTFRDELSFPIDFTSSKPPLLNYEPKIDEDILAASQGISFYCNLVIHKPVAISESIVTLGFLKIRLKDLNFSAFPSQPVTDWFTIYDKPDGNPLTRGAAIRIKLQLLN
jgi:hypothetical protein